MSLVPSFLDLLQPLSCVMTESTFQSFVTVARGWAFARRHTVTGMILAGDAVRTKHHSAYQRLFAAARWSLEVTNHDAKGQLGFEEPQEWSKHAVQRTAPVAMLLYWLVTLWFSREGHFYYQPPTRPWSIGKTDASFADMLATLRCQSVKKEVLSMRLHGSDSRTVLKCLIHAVKQAA